MTKRTREIRILAALCVGMAACSVQDEPGEAFLEAEVTDGESADVEAEASESTEDAEARALEHFVAELGTGPDAPEARVLRTNVDERGRAHVRLQQLHRGVPVFGGEAIVHLGRGGALRRITDGLVRDLHVGVRPTLSRDEATTLALEHVGADTRASRGAHSELMVLRHEGVDHLVHRLRIPLLDLEGDPAIPVVFVDARSGEVVLEYDDLEHVILDNGDAATFDMQNGVNYGAAVPADSSDPVANDAHTHAIESLDFFLTELGRDSFDDAGARVDSYVHYRNDYVNAFWDGQRLTFGDGDGVIAGPLVSLDIVSHELSHGVTAHTAGLIYMNESGALNEATSDIFGAATEAFVDGAIDPETWMVGEDAWTPGVGGDALRYMDDPTADGSSREHYSTRYIGAADNGGVHWNSGIANLFFYLLSEGGDHPNPVHRLGTVTGIGIQEATQIWYAALTNEMVANTSFAGARAATLAACADLFGIAAPQCSSVADAWCEVGVGGNACDPAASCEGSCDGSAPAGCYCDALCVQYGDCCADYAVACLEGAPSCAGSCGGQSPGECWCDASCQIYGDCCPDYPEECT